MKVLLLAAGLSNRMKPVGDKNFLNFLGKPLIQWQLEALTSQGFEEIVIVARGKALEKLKILVSDLKMQNVEFTEQLDNKGMCGAVLSAKSLIENSSLMIVSGNDIVDESAFKLMKEAIKSGDSENYLIGKKVEKYFPGGYLELDNDGFIHNIIEKPGDGNEPSDLVNLVIHYFKDGGKLLKYLEDARSANDDIYEVAMANMMKDGLKFKALSYDGYWQPIKFPWHIQKVFNYLFDKADKKIADSAKVSEHAVVKGDVIIGENVKIFEGAIVNGPVYLGDNTIVANNALVRDSHIGNDCVIGFSTEIARSFLGNDVWTHSNYVGDSVIGNDVSFGAGTVTGNLRLDEKNIKVNCSGNRVDSGQNKLGLITGNNVRVGINTSFMPGVKVGNDCFIGANIAVCEDIPDDSFVRAKFELKVTNNREHADASSRNNIKKNL